MSTYYIHPSIAAEVTGRPAIVWWQYEADSDDPPFLIERDDGAVVASMDAGRVRIDEARLVTVRRKPCAPR